MEHYDLTALIDLLIYSAGMKRTLGAIIKHLEPDTEGYLVTLRKDLQHALDVYEDRYDKYAISEDSELC